MIKVEFKAIRSAAFYRGKFTGYQYSLILRINGSKWGIYYIEGATINLVPWKRKNDFLIHGTVCPLAKDPEFKAIRPNGRLLFINSKPYFPLNDIQRVLREQAWVLISPLTPKHPNSSISIPHGLKMVT